MQRHHLQMIFVFAVSLVSVLLLGPLLGMAIGLSSALVLAPWSNRLLRQWLRYQLNRALQDEDSASTIVEAKEASDWKPIARTLHYAMDVKGIDIDAELGARDLSDQDIRHLVELDREAIRAGVQFSVVDEGKKSDEPLIDTALRRRVAKPIVLPKQV